MDNTNMPGVPAQKKVIIKALESYFDVHTQLCFRKYVI